MEERADIAVISLNRPDKLNAISVEMLDLLIDAIERIGRSEAIGWRLVVAAALVVAGSALIGATR